MVKESERYESQIDQIGGCWLWQIGYIIRVQGWG